MHADKFNGGDDLFAGFIHAPLLKGIKFPDTLHRFIRILNIDLRAKDQWHAEANNE